MLEEYLSLLGFSPEESHLYLSLVRSGPVTLLAASRNSGMERTRLYRMVDSLKDRGLIEEIPQYRHRTIQAASPSTIEMMAKEAGLKARMLSRSFPAFLRSIQSLLPSAAVNNVVLYKGREGIRQMAWHILRTKGLYRTCSYRFWDELLGSNFTLDLNREMVKMRLRVHDLFSDQYFEYKRQWLKTRGSKPPGNWDWWHSRYISEKILKIDQNIDIYNDVVAYYHWQGEETFGVEIYNPRVALFHQQMHDIVWKMAKPTPDIDWSQPAWK